MAGQLATVAGVGNYSLVRPFDRWLFHRSLAYTALGTAVVTLVVVATDEAFSTLGMRVARLCAFGPLLGAVGASAALTHARSRGELRAVEALGASPFQQSLGAMASGWVYGALATLLLVTPLADPSSLFPSITIHSVWLPDGRAMLEPELGIRVHPNGMLDLLQARPAQPTVFVADGVTAALAIGPAALMMPPWVSAPLRLVWRVLGLSAALGLTVYLLHSVAAGQSSRALLVFGALPLAVQASVAHLGLRYPR